MQVHNRAPKGLVDKFEIKSKADYHNNIPIEYRWSVFIFDNDDNLRKYLVKFDNKIEKFYKFNAITYPVTTSYNLNEFSIRDLNNMGHIYCSDSSIDDEVIAHECYHAAYETLVSITDKIIPKNYDQQEVIAYLTGQYVKSFNHEYNNRKSRTGFFRTKSSIKNKRGIQRINKKISYGS